MYKTSYFTNKKNYGYLNNMHDVYIYDNKMIGGTYPNQKYIKLYENIDKLNVDHRDQQDNIRIVKNIIYMYYMSHIYEIDI